VQSEKLYTNQFSDEYIDRTANDAAVAFSMIWVPCSFFINAGLIYAGEKCGRVFAAKLPLFVAIFVHAICFYYFNNPIEVLTPYGSIEFTGPKFRDQLHQLQSRTIISVVALHLLAIALIGIGPKPISPEQESETNKTDPIKIEVLEFSD